MTDHPWLKTYPEGIDWHAGIPQEPLWTLIDDAARQAPERVAIDFLGQNHTYGALADQIARAAKGFQALGVRPGVKVGLFLPNCPQFVVCYFAILKAGGTVVNYNPLYTVRELKHQVEDSETDIMVTLNLTALYPKTAELLRQTQLQKIVIMELHHALPPLKRLLYPLVKRKEIAAIPKDNRHVWHHTLMNNDGLFAPVSVNPRTDPAVLQYTGGTTGTPKGAVLTHGNIYANTIQTALYFQNAVKPEEEVMLSVLPFFHVFAMTAVMCFTIHQRWKMILHPRFELINVLKDIAKKRPTILPGVPTMYNAIINHKDLKQYDLSSIKFCVSGGAALPMDTKQRFEELTGCDLVEGYGLTETSPITHANPVPGVNKPGSIGLPLPGTELEIRDLETGEPITEPGENGEICIRGPQVMQGYFNKPEETAATLKVPPSRDQQEEGETAPLLHTGDIGHLDADGYTFIVDRLKEMIIAGGFNIYPRHVEEAIYLHPEVVECAVIGVPDDYRGETVKAFIVKKTDSPLDAEGLRAFLRDNLAKHMIPTHVEFRDELPKSMIGKILKKELKEQ